MRVLEECGLAPHASAVEISRLLQEARKGPKHPAIDIERAAELGDAASLEAVVSWQRSKAVTIPATVPAEPGSTILRPD